MVWFDPGLGYYIPGIIAEENHSNGSVLIRANYIGKNHIYEMKNFNKMCSRSEMPTNGVDDMIFLNDLSEGSILWNLKIRYETKQQIYVKKKCFKYIFSKNLKNSNSKTYSGSILLAINPRHSS